MAAVFYLQLMEAKAVSQFIQVGGVGVGDIKPGNTGQRLMGGTHPKEVYIVSSGRKLPPERFKNPHQSCIFSWFLQPLTPALVLTRQDEVPLQRSTFTFEHSKF